jgi:acetyltransferase-like isoleucine patch superfamily enzyme
VSGDRAGGAPGRDGVGGGPGGWRGGFILRRLRGIVAARSLGGSVEVSGGGRIGRGVRIRVARGAALRVGRGCSLGDGCRVVVCGGEIELGAGVVLGEGCTLIAQREIRIGEGSRLEEGASILDFGPAPIDPERPARVQPLHTAAVVLGAGAVVGLRAAIGPGVRLPVGGRVEPGAVLGGLAEPLLAALDLPPAGPAGGKVGGRRIVRSAVREPDARAEAVRAADPAKTDEVEA